MNEHEPTPTPEVRTAPEHLTPDWRRLEGAHSLHSVAISDGIARALTEHADVDDNTARCIAHVLGRAYGRESALANFGRTGEGQYLTLRDEYLALYADERADDYVKELIDWLGTYLVAREGTGSGRQFMNEHLPPRLHQLLVRTEVSLRGVPVTANIPATWDSSEVDRFTGLLSELVREEDHSFQAFLTLPDVNAGADNLQEAFHESYAGTYASQEAALRVLSPLEEWEGNLADWCIDNGVEYEALKWNYAPLMARLREIYDIVERKGFLHAFIK